MNESSLRIDEMLLCFSTRVGLRLGDGYRWLRIDCNRAQQKVHYFFLYGRLIVITTLVFQKRL